MKRFYKCSQIYQNQKRMKLALKDKRAKNRKNKYKYCNNKKLMSSLK